MSDLSTITGLSRVTTGAPAGAGGERSAPLPAAQFESVFYSLMIKNLRQTLSDEGLFAGDKTDSFGSLFDMYMGQHFAQAQPLGIARMLETYQEATDAS